MSLSRIPFTEADESRILSLGSWMTFIGWVNFVMAGFLALGGVCVAISGADMVLSLGGAVSLGPAFAVIALVIFLGLAVVLIFQGRLLLDAKSSFREVVTSDDDDQMHVSHALGKLRTFFVIEMIFAVLQVINGGFQVLGAMS